MNQQQLEVVETLKEYIPNLMDGILEVINSITKNKFKDTTAMMSDIIEGIQWVQEALILTSKGLYSEVSGVNLNELLSDILKSYEDEDIILAKDLLKYELLPLTDKFLEIVEKM